MSRMTILNCRAVVGTPLALAPERLDIAIEKGIVVEIAPAGSLPAAGDVVDGTDLLITAGFVNGHTHSHENFTKGRYENLPLEMWMNYVRPPEPVIYTQRQVYLRTMIGIVEAIRSGTTTIVDDLNIMPILIPEHVEAVVQAYEDSGIRALVAPGVFDAPFFRAVPFVEDEFPRDLLARLSSTPKTAPDEAFAWLEGFVRDRHPATRRVGAAISPSAPQRCTPEFLMRMKELADREGLPIILHVQETRLQVVTGRLHYGRTMIEQLAALGFLDANVSLIHGVWLNPREIDLIARAGASVQHNPTSNLALGSGVAPLRELLDAGVNVSLGTDACGSSISVSMLKALSGTALVQKIRTPDYRRWLTAAEALSAATIGGGRALGMDGLARGLVVGASADLVGFRLDTIGFRPLGDAIRQLVYGDVAPSVDLVVVDGAIVMRGGRIATFDEDAILDEIAQEHARLEPQLDRADRDIGALADVYARIYARGLAEPIADDTHPALFGAPACGCRIDRADGPTCTAIE